MNMYPSFKAVIENSGVDKLFLHILFSRPDIYSVSGMEQEKYLRFIPARRSASGWEH